jgi:hypothetical protein
METVHLNRETAEMAARIAAKARGCVAGNVTPLSPSVRLPSFFTHWYDMYQTDLAGETIVLMVPDETGRFSARQVSRHMAFVARNTASFPVLVTRRMTEARAKRFVAAGIHFLTPSRHLNLPDLPPVLENFDPPRGAEICGERPSDAFSAVTQAIVLMRVLGRLPSQINCYELANRLGLEVTTALKAAGELAEDGLCNVSGEEIDFLLDGSELFKAAAGKLASPIRRVEHFVGRHPDNLPLAGDAALCKGTMLIQNDVPAFAVHEGRHFLCVEAAACDEEDADFRIEKWDYRPDLLGDEDVVDSLSLHVIFRDHGDDRVSIAAWELLEPVFGEVGPLDESWLADRGPQSR